MCPVSIAQQMHVARCRGESPSVSRAASKERRAQGLYLLEPKTRRSIPSRSKRSKRRWSATPKPPGITANCDSLRHTFASNLLEHGAEVVVIRDFLGHSQIASSQRYAKNSGKKVKQEYMRTTQKILKQGQV